MAEAAPALLPAPAAPIVAHTIDRVYCCFLLLLLSINQWIEYQTQNDGCGSRPCCTRCCPHNQPAFVVSINQWIGKLKTQIKVFAMADAAPALLPAPAAPIVAHIDDDEEYTVVFTLKALGLRLKLIHGKILVCA